MRRPYDFTRPRKKIGEDPAQTVSQPNVTEDTAAVRATARKAAKNAITTVELPSLPAKEKTRAEHPKKPPATLSRLSFARKRKHVRAKLFQRKPLEKTVLRTSIVRRKKAKPTKPLFLLPPAKPPKPAPEAAQDEFLKLSKAYEHVNLQSLEKKLAQICMR